MGKRTAEGKIINQIIKTSNEKEILEKVKAQEKEKIKKGYKWVRVDSLTLKLIKNF